MRKNFPERSDALQEMAELEAEFKGMPVAPKVQRTRLSSAEVGDAEAALLQAGIHKLSNVVSHYLTLESRTKEQGISFDQAIDFTESHCRSEIKNISIINAYNEFLKNKPFGSNITKSHYETCLSRLLAQDPNKYVHMFTVADIEKIISEYKNLNSRDTYRRAFSAFLLVHPPSL